LKPSHAISFGGTASNILCLMCFCARSPTAEWIVRQIDEAWLDGPN